MKTQNPNFACTRLPHSYLLGVEIKTLKLGISEVVASFSEGKIKKLLCA